MFRSFFATTIVLFFASGIFAQDPIHINFNVEDGLPSPTVFDIYTDRVGNLWFSTPNGACRYDSRTFTNFGIREGLEDPFIIQVKEDTAGRIWFMSRSGKLFFLENSGIRPHGLNDAIVESLGVSVPVDFEPVSPDSVILAHWYWTIRVNEHGVFKSDPRKRKAIGQIVNPEWLRKEVWPVQGYFEAERTFLTGGFLYHGTYAEDQIIIRHRDGQDTIATSASAFQDNGLRMRMTNIFHDTFYIGLHKRIEGYTRGKQFFGFTAKSEITNSIFRDKNKLFIGTFDHGLNVIDLDLGKVAEFFTNTRIYCIAKDVQGGFWLGTDEKGVLYIPSFDVMNVPCDYPERRINRITGNKNHLVVSTKKGALLMKSRQEKEWKALITNTRSLNKMDLPGYDWVFAGTSITKEFFVYGMLPEGKFVYKPAPHGLLATFQADVNGKILASNHHNLLIHHTPDFSKFEVIKYTSPASAICALDDSLIVFCTINGILTYDWKNFTTIPVPKGVSSPLVLTGCVKHKDLVFFTSKGQGMLLYELVGGQLHFRKVLETEGRFFQCITSQTDRVLAGSELGLYEFQTNGKMVSWRNVHLEGGLPAAEVNDIYVTDSLIYLATSDGVQSLPPGFPSRKTSLIPVNITEIMINDSVVPDPNRANSFEHFTGILSFKIQTYSFKQREAQVFQYRLLPGDSAWLNTSLPLVQYTSLAPGNYTFQISTGSGGADEYRFTITPPFWQTWWFRSILGLFILLLIGLPVVWKIRETWIKTQHQLAFSGLKLSAVSSQMNPHFIFNAMNSIHSFVLKNDNILSAQYLARFATLMRSILDHSLKPLIPLKESLQGIDLYVELEQLRFNNKFSYIKTIDEAIPADRFMVPPLLIQPFVENAILHGLVPKAGPGRLELIITRQGNELNCVIKDDGIGHKISAQSKEKSGLLHAGQSTRISNERIELFNELFKTNIKLKISDLCDNSKNLSGTMAEIIIPYTKPFIDDQDSHC